MATGYTQTYGIDYQETSAPVAKLNTVRVLLSLASNLDWPLFQLDVKNAFLNGDLEEEVNMDLPPGFETLDKKGMVCRLRKSLYGLKQSPRAWFDRFTSTIRRYGYKQAHTDHMFFQRFEGKVVCREIRDYTFHPFYFFTFFNFPNPPNHSIFFRQFFSTFQISI